MPGIPYLSEPLADGHVVVRDSAPRDIPEILIAYEDDPELHIRLGEERPPSGAELGRWAEEEPYDRATGTRAKLTILVPGSDVLRGQISIHRVEWENQRAELGIWLVPQLRGKGLGARALGLVSAWLLEHCGLARVQMLTQQDNEPLIRTALAAGFLHEGVLRGYLRERGARVDAVMLSRLRRDLRG